MITRINNAQGMSVLFGLICGLPETPLTAIHVLYCNLICAFTLGFHTAVEPTEDGISLPCPMRVNQSIVLVSLTSLLFPTSSIDAAILLPLLFIHSLQAKYVHYLPPLLFHSRIIFLLYWVLVAIPDCQLSHPSAPNCQHRYPSLRWNYENVTVHCFENASNFQDCY